MKTIELYKPSFDVLSATMIDIEAPSHGVQVEVNTGVSGDIVWINVDSVCVLRVCRAPVIEVNDRRMTPAAVNAWDDPEALRRRADALVEERIVAAAAADRRMFSMPNKGRPE